MDNHYFPLLNILKKINDYPCCQIAYVQIENLQDREKDFLISFMPEAKSAIVLGHHIKTLKEWTWYQPLEGHERCEADDHTLEVCIKIKNELEAKGFQSKIVPYPGGSGLQFRYVAQSAGLGKIAKNAFLLHPVWGPWIHLRVMATEAPIKDFKSNQMIKDVCIYCDKCIDSCPADAFKDGFNGLICRKYRQEKGEYIPIGDNRTYNYCLICAFACPIGEKPKEKSNTV